MGFFQMVSFLVASSESLSKLFDVDLSLREWRLVAFAVCFPFTFMRSLKKVAILSFIANVAAVCMLFCII